MGGRNVFACSKKQKLDSKRKPVASENALARSGTKHMGRMVSAAVAEEKKRRTGEGLAVQHVALKDDRTLAGAKAAKAAAQKRHAVAMKVVTKGRVAKRARLA